MNARAADFLTFDKDKKVYRISPEQAVRDDVEKHYWVHVGRTIVKDWRLYVMLIPMLLVFLFWRYFPMYELLGCFKVPDLVRPVSQQYFFRLLVFQPAAGRRGPALHGLLEGNAQYLHPELLRFVLRLPDPHHPSSVLQ